MNIDQLRYFSDLSKTNSMNETAKRMFITQPSLSESIKRLERELDCLLVKRSKTGVEFTEEGKLVLEYANNMLEQHAAMKQALLEQRNHQIPQGKLTIGVGANFSNTFLPQLIVKMYRQYPDIKLHILEDSADNILTALQAGELDFGVFGIYKDPKSGDMISPSPHCLSDPTTLNKLKFLPLYQDPMVCVMSKNHPLSGYKALSNTQLQNIPQTTIITDIAAITDSNYFYASLNLKVHQQFMLEEGTVCRMPYSAYISQCTDKNIIAIPLTDHAPTMNYLVYQKAMLEDHKALYSRLIETVQTLSAELS